MSRIPHGAQTLIDEVQAQRKTAKWTTEDEPDGFDTHRTIGFDKGTSKWLEPLLEASQDERVESYQVVKERLLVTFSPEVVADRSTPWRLLEVDSVLNA